MYNSNFSVAAFNNNRNIYTRKMAEAKMVDNGYEDYYFIGCSFSNGASYYFEIENGKRVRVSDHPLTGKRAFSEIQIDIRK